MVMVIKSNVESVSISNPDGWNPPFSTDGLEYAGIYGRGDVTKNYATDGSDAVQNGVITVDNHFANLSSANFLSTDVHVTKQTTIIVVAKKTTPASARKFLVSSYTTNTEYGRSLVISADPDRQILNAYSHYKGKDAAGVDFNGALAAKNTLTNADGRPAFLYMTDTGVQITTGDKTQGTQTTNAATGTIESYANPALSYRVGTSQWESGAETSVAAALIFSRALSDAEVTQVYEYFQGYFARRGITI